ncbi:hypothetical protein IAU60_002908 [Kwoniella sp. DSM 27419]
MDPVPIPPSVSDLERRRLESTIDNDLHSLSLTSIPTSGASHSFISSISESSLEYPRAETMSFQSYPNNSYGPHGTPRAAAGRASSYGGAGEQSMFVGASPVSTAGHHASAVTLGAGVFGRHGRDATNGDGEFDPERSLGRLVGELGRVMGSDKIPSRPTSPFSPPRSPSPLPSLQAMQGQNLSFTLTRNDPLLSPPSSGGENTQNYAHASMQTKQSESSLRFSSTAKELGNEIRASQQQQPQPKQRRALSDSTAHNVQQTPSLRQPVKDKSSGNHRVRTIRDEARAASAPVRGYKESSLDVTGLTALMATPAKGGEYDSIDRNGDVGGEGSGALAQTLATLHARLRALETENTVSRRRVRELEDELERAKREVELAKQEGGKRLRDVIGEKSALEDLVKSLRAHLARLTVEVEQNKALIIELRAVAAKPQPKPVTPESPMIKSELGALRREIERLTKEVERLGGIVEEGLETRKKARGERTLRMEKDEMERLVRQVVQEENEEVAKAQRDMLKRQQAANEQKQRERSHVQLATPQQDQPDQQEVQSQLPSRLRQGLHTAAATVPSISPPTVKPNRVRPVTQHPTPPPSDDESIGSPTPASRSISYQGSMSMREGSAKSARTKSFRQHRNSPRTPAQAGPSSPFPSIVGEELEAEFFSPSRKSPAATTTMATPGPRNSIRIASESEDDERETGPLHREPNGQELPPQTVLARVVAELEDDFVHYKAIYAELADQYKLLDPASVSAKRHVLAEHLREVIDTLERKADQIGDLYGLLQFSDRTVSSRPTGERWVGKSVHDVLRMVRESLGDGVWERLEGDLGRKGRRRSGGIV